MFRVQESIRVNAPIDRCFLLSTSIALVEQTIGLSPVEGKTSGLIVADDRLVWRGWKFGLPAMHETLITGYDRPRFFQDTMGKGRFKFFQHDHRFERIDGKTVMSDEVRLSLPLGMVGRWVARWIVVPHVVKLMRQRMKLLRRVAESSEWQRYVGESTAVGPDSI